MAAMPDERARANGTARSAEPEGELLPMTREEVATAVSIAISVVRPLIQFGRGKRLPHQSDDDRKRAALLVVEHCERSGVRWFRQAPAPPHSTP